MCKEGKVALLLGKGVEEVDECILLDREVVAEKEVLLYGELMGEFWSPPLLL